MHDFKIWLATSPLATAFKIGVGAGLAWVLENIDALSVPTAFTPAVIALVTIAINYLNSQDPRYGKVR